MTGAGGVNFVLHLISACVLGLVGGGVILWSFMTPRVRWDRFWIGLVLLLVAAPIAAVVTVVRMARSWERGNEHDGAYVRMDTTYAVDTVVAVNSLESVDSTTVVVDYGLPETWQLPGTPSTPEPR